jgi:Domain of unknown function (DUF1840)
VLYKFKSKATGDLIMLEPAGRRILQLIGKEASAQGIIEPNDMPAAIAALQQAIAQEEAHQKEMQAQAAQDTSTDEPPSSAETISLKQRALPFIDMLQRAHAENKDIVWGV